MLKYLKFPLLSLVFGLVLAGLLSWMQNHNFNLVIHSLLTVSLLSVLEISLSFDNAVVNATVIQRMNSIWKKRFLLWGMLIAVFGMRFLFPVLIVAFAGGISLWDSVHLAVQSPDQYAKLMLSSHFVVNCFGGTFLLMVALDFFLNRKKEIHWMPWLEKPLNKISSLKFIKIILVLFILTILYSQFPLEKQGAFLKASVYGLTAFLVVHGISHFLENSKMIAAGGLSTGLGLFLYLEVLDASFSFDGVVAAFAITKQLYEIIIGLGVGAFFVRGLTLYLVDHQKLKQYRYLEHGAFYALFVLAVFMLLDDFFHFSEWTTGLAGACVLLASVFWSIYINRKARAYQN